MIRVHMYIIEINISHYKLFCFVNFLFKLLFIIFFYNYSSSRTESLSALAPPKKPSAL